jgi:hypothetical protein
MTSFSCFPDLKPSPVREYEGVTGVETAAVSNVNTPSHRW